LQSIDWSHVTIDVFTIEVQEQRSQIKTFMEAHGYRRVEPPPLRNDDVYISEKTFQIPYAHESSAQR